VRASLPRVWQRLPRARACTLPGRESWAYGAVVRVMFCGVRGSTPAPGPEFVRIGGHTSCVAVAPDGDAPVLLLDAGTGIRRVTELLGPAPFRGAILLTHLHWDHTQGLPFFGSADRDDAEVTLAMPAQGDPLALLSRAMGPPHFPITPEGLRGHWSFVGWEAGHHQVEGCDVLAADVPHKGGRTFGYRVSAGGRCLAYLPDHGPLGCGPGPDGLGARHEAALALAQGADVLIHGAQFTAAEARLAADYGHATVDYAVGLAEAAGVGRLVLSHHGPGRTDAGVEAIAGAAATTTTIPVVAAAEGLTLDV
jgi:phosphoribosyl 1,2-cyclic phosphodiesterase